MIETRFYLLQRRTTDEALPGLLEQALRENLRVVVQSPDRQWIEALDERLWTYSDESFLPHGLARDGDPGSQPVFLTTEADSPNEAALRILVGGARAAPLLEAPPAGCQRLVILFEGADEEARAAARAQWAELKAAGHAPSHWREEDDGGWAPAR
jgi:DNA polymerase-3 subunit chi